MISNQNTNYQFLKIKEVNTVIDIGETILGVPTDELGQEFILEFDRIVFLLDDYLHKEIHKLLGLYNSRLFSLIFVGSLSKFVNMPDEKKLKFTKKLMLSRIPIFRTMYVTLRALCSWSYYSLEKSHFELDFLGKTIGKEHITPTLLYGKEPYIR